VFNITTFHKKQQTFAVKSCLVKRKPMAPIDPISLSTYAVLDCDFAELNCWTGFPTSSSEIAVKLLTVKSSPPEDELGVAGTGTGGSTCHCQLGSEQVLWEYIVILVVGLVRQGGENPDSDWL
jgi:hypothetical protein